MPVHNLAMMKNVGLVEVVSKLLPISTEKKAVI